MQINCEWLLHDIQNNVYCLIYRNLIPYDFCCELYNDCVNYCNRQYPITVFGISTLQPRYTCVFADPCISFHKYSGQEHPALPWTNATKRLRDFIATPDFAPNACLCNGYVLPEHNVGWHSDKDLKDANQTVVTVSICGSRRFSFREKKNHNNKITTYLHNGDVVYFWGKTNELFDHTILKALKSDDQRPRYSLTFRVLESN